MTRPVPHHLQHLAADAIRRNRAVGLIDESVVALTTLVDQPDWTPVHGLRCGPTVGAIAFPFGWQPQHQLPLALAIDRHDTAVVVEPGRAGALFVDEEESLLIDAGRRALGLPTAPPAATPLELNDAVWLHRILELTLDSPLGEPPPWPILSSLHPLGGGGLTPEGLRHRRRTLQTGWHTVHQEAQRAGVDWVPLTPALSAWFDHGSLARWLLASLPEATTIVAELGELLRPSDFARVADALALSGR